MIDTQPNTSPAGLFLTPRIGRQAISLLCYLALIVSSAITAAGQGNQTQCLLDCTAFVSGDDQHQAGNIRVRVKAVKKESQPDQFEWVLDAYPVEEEINIVDAGLKKEVVQAIEKIKADKSRCGFGGHDCQFDTELLRKLSNSLDINFNPPDVLKAPPTAEGEVQVCTLCVIYPSRKPQNFQTVIAVKTLAARRDNTFSTHKLEEAGAVGAASAVPVNLAFDKADTDNVMADNRVTTIDQARDRVTGEMLKAANTVFKIAVKHRLLDVSGQLLTQPDTQDFQARKKAVESEVSQFFDLQESTGAYQSEASWGAFDSFVGTCGGVTAPPPAFVGLCSDPQKPALILMVAGVQFIRGASIKVVPDDLDLQFRGTETGRALNKKRKDAEKELNKKLLLNLMAQPGRLVTSADVVCDMKKLCDVSLDCAAAMPAPGDCATTKRLERISSRPRIPPDKIDDGELSASPRLVYQVRRNLPQPWEISVKGGGRYSPEEKFLATVGLGERNALHIGEQLSLDFARGEEAQKVRFQFARPFTKSESGFRLRDVGISVNYFRDRDVRLGNLTTEEIAQREAGSKAHLSFGYDSFALDDYWPQDCKSFDLRKRTHWAMTGEAALEYRDVTIPESDRLLTVTRLNRNLLPAENTQVANLSLDLSAGVSHDFRRRGHAGLGQTSLSLNAKLERGLGLFGANYRYGKASLDVRAEVFFGRRSPQDFFFGYARGIGRGGAKTPVFELFRLGGQQNVRGIEEGEFVGRRLTFEQTEFGINSLALWQLVRGKKGGQLNHTPCEEPPGEDRERSTSPVDFANFYLKVFFDRARISDPTSFRRSPVGNMPGGPPDILNRRATGYGFSLELRNLPSGEGGQRVNISIGYARSPQSSLHRSGTMFTAVNFVIY